MHDVASRSCGRLRNLSDRQDGGPCRRRRRAPDRVASIRHRNADPGAGISRCHQGASSSGRASPRAAFFSRTGPPARWLAWEPRPARARGAGSLWASWFCRPHEWLDLLVLEAPHLFARPGNPYVTPDGKDWPDNGVRFAALSRMAADIGLGAIPSFVPDVVHAHDWQAGLTPAYLHLAHQPRPATVMTVHNLAYQGKFPHQM